MRYFIFHHKWDCDYSHVHINRPAVITDDVIEGNCTEEDYRAVVIGMVGSKTLGTFASLLLSIPASYLIVFIAKVI